MDENRTPTLCLDGSAVRRIREEKKLTQLYVAKVVGVTTDTISRWENNRYPTVKRENVLRLAEALEVPLDEVLRGANEDGEGPEAEPESASSPRFRLWPAVAVLLIFLFLFAGYRILRKEESFPMGVAAQRLLPRYAAPGNVVPVRIRLHVEGETKGFILREKFPSGWALIEANPPASSLDNAEGTIRWIIKPGEAPQQVISYLVRVAPGSEMGKGEVFGGEVVASPNGRSTPAPISGALRIEVAPHLWADLNGDGIIDDGEMLQASEVFDEMEGVHLDWQQLEAIWDAGRYRWDSEQRSFHPIRSSSASFEASVD